MPIEPTILERIVTRYLEVPGAQFKITFAQNGDPMPLTLLNGEGLTLKAEDALHLMGVNFGFGWSRFPGRSLVITIDRTLNVARFVGSLASQLDNIEPIDTVISDS